jgi:hypothetical protein
MTQQCMPARAGRARWCAFDVTHVAILDEI